MNRLGRIAAVVALASVSLAGCRLDTLSPVERTTSSISSRAAANLDAFSRDGGFFPLAVGNRWHYARTFEVQDPASPGTPPFVFTSAVERTLVSEVTLESRAYTVERVHEMADGQDWLDWIYYRQDRGGLYELDSQEGPPPGDVTPKLVRAPGLLGAIDEPVRVPADPAMRAAVVSSQERIELVRACLGLRLPSRRHPHPAPGEIVPLAYPLVPGRAWVLRADPRFTAHVEGLDVLRLPAGRFAAWRVRISSVLFGPDDRVHVWYSRQGFLKLEAHVESAGTDESGNPTGTVVSLEREVLDGLSLVAAAGD